MKKNMATAMAAAMTFGTVAPAFATAADTVTAVPVDFRGTTGERLITDEDGIKLHTRSEAFTTNFTPDNFEDDTLKIKDAKVVKEFAGADEKLSTKKDNLYVLSAPMKASEVEAAKGLFETVKAEIKEYAEEVDAKGEKVYTVKTENAVAMTTTNATVVDSYQEVKIRDAKGNLVKVYKFTGVKAEDVVTEDLTKLFEGIDTELVFSKQIAKDEYFNLSAFQYVLTKNADKFDVEVKEENANVLTVIVKKKGTKDVVVEMKINGVQNIDKTQIVTIPAKTDIDGHWAEKEIKEAMLRGQIDASATFRAKDGITRAEFSKIVCTMFGIEATKGQEEPFHDVNKDAWYYEYVTALYNYGTTRGTVINGYGDDFRPNAEITRQEAAKMIASAHHISKGKSGVVETTFVSNTTGEKVDTDIKTRFKDDAEIKAWADESVEYLANNKIVLGNPDNTFKPASNINRAEALLMISRASK